MGVALEILASFAMCGILCVLAQLLSFARAKPPHVLNLYLALGGLLTPVGLMGLLVAVAPGGFTAVICGAGNAFEMGAFLSVKGDALMLVAVALLFVVTIVLGQCVGEYRFRALRKQEDLTGPGRD